MRLAESWIYQFMKRQFIDALNMRVHDPGIRHERLCRSGWLAVRLGISLGVVLIATSCGSSLQGPNDSAVEEVFRPFYVTPTDTKATSDLDIFVDGSMSMKGYVAADGSNYSRLIREVLQSATAAQFNLNVYKFTSTVTPVTHLPLSQLQSQGFYDGRDTPLAALLNRLTESPSHTAMIISDLVQSEGGVDSLGLVKALAQLARRRPQMRLLGYRSSFAGDYYPESHAGGSPRTIRLAVSQSIPGSGRPFYLMVVAPNAESMKHVEDYLLSRLSPVQSFNPTGPPVVIDNIDLPSDKEGEKAWSLYSRLIRKDMAAGLRLESAFMLKKPTLDPTVTLPLIYQVRLNLPLRDASRLSWDAVRATWTDKVGFGKPTAVDLPLSGALEKSGKQMRLNLTLRKPEPRTWDAYYVRIRAGDANLNVPNWVIDWDTDNDSVASNGNRTFQLKLLVESMANAISERVIFADYVLKIGRGD